MHQTPFIPNALAMSDQGSFPQPSPFGSPGMPPPTSGGAAGTTPGPFASPGQTPYPGTMSSGMPGAVPGATIPWSDAGQGGGGGFSSGNRGGGGRMALIIVGVLAISGLSTAAWLITRNDAQNQIEDAQAQVDDVLSTIPEITIPEITIPVITIPAGDVTLPAVTLPPGAESTVPVETVPTETAPVVPVTTAPPVVIPEVNLFIGTQAQEMVASIATARAAAPLRILRVAIYPTYSFAQVQDPTIPANVDEFPWRDGSVGPSSPVQLIGDGDLEANLFSDTEVNWAAIPGLIEASAAALAIEGGEVTHVIVERNLPFTADVVIRVYVNGPRNSGFVEADAQGNITAVRPS